MRALLTKPSDSDLGNKDSVLPRIDRTGGLRDLRWNSGVLGGVLRPAARRRVLLEYLAEVGLLALRSVSPEFGGVGEVSEARRRLVRAFSFARS